MFLITPARWGVLSCLFLSIFLTGCHPRSSADQPNTIPESYQYAAALTARGCVYTTHHSSYNSPQVVRYKEGIAYFRTALCLKPDYHDASYYLGDALIESGKQEEGVAILQTLAKNNDDFGHLAQKKLAKMQRSGTDTK